MKKVFLIHGFEGEPNGGWRPWLMGELAKLDVYACALAMPDPYNPLPEEWVGEIERHVEKNPNDEIYLVGHSLGCPAILRFLEKTEATNVQGVVLVSGPVHKVDNKKVNLFLDKPLDFGKIKAKIRKSAVIHGDNDSSVSVEDGKHAAQMLGSELIIVENGGHLNGSSGWTTLPQVLDALTSIFS